MKKSLIWILTIVMATMFGALLYFQIMYLGNMAKMRDEQFTEAVMRSLNSTSEFLAREETLHFLEQDANIIESSFYDYYNSGGNVSQETVGTNEATLKFPDATQSIGARYGSLQEVIRSQYLYQKGLLTEVILSILRDSGSRPVMERADSVDIRNCLRTELANNGIREPFVFAVYNRRNDLLYTCGDYLIGSKDIYSIQLFNNTDYAYRLDVEFPTKNTYIFSSVKFIIPWLAFTVMLLVIFIYTIVMIFRQKKLSEMKSDFVNNMTHELKTPISTISLAGQMLSDPSISKSPTTIAHLSEVITEESKRLRFQVEKVLHLSVIDDASATLNFTEVDANDIISGVVNTFKLKVEKLGGRLSTNLGATDARVTVDEMQFTNVIFNLLDNALKYMRENTDPELEIDTLDQPGNRLEIRVKDNGIGIRKEYVKRIFEKFYRVSTGNRHDVKGFGLGLAYVRKMINVFGGTISVESEFGKGSTFVIDLPLSKSASRKD